MYKVKGIYKNKKIHKAVVDNYSEDKIKVELWSKKYNFDTIPLGQEHYDITKIIYDSRQDYLSMLFNNKDGSTARRYLKNLNLKIIKKVI